MTKEMTFNGVDMSRFFRITDIIRPIGNTRSVSTDDAPWLGANVQQVKRGAKEHTIKFDMRAENALEMEQLKHELAGVLDVTEPVKIEYGDEPDKYYMGLPVDDITPDNLARWFQRSELTLLIPDGVAHSTAYKRFDNANVAMTDSKMVFQITNNGTVPAYPIITVKNNADNSYLGLVSQLMAFEVGSKLPVTQVTPQSSASTSVSVQPTTQITTHYSLDYRGDKIATGYLAGAKNVAPYTGSARLVGTLETYTSGNYIRMMKKGSGNTAASLTWDISKNADKTDEYLWWRQIFQTSAVYEMGYLRIFITDENGRFLYGVETSKSVMGYDCTYKLLVADGKGGERMAKIWTFYGTSQENQNPFCLSKGQVELIRSDDKIQVYWQGSSPTLTFPEIKGKRATKLHVVFGDYNHSMLVKDIRLSDLLFRRETKKIVNVSTVAPVASVAPVPARVYLGRDVVINSENDTLMMDGIAKNSEIVDGSQWPVIPAGDSNLEIYVSDFVKEKPMVTIEFEERWL